MRSDRIPRMALVAAVGLCVVACSAPSDVEAPSSPAAAPATASPATPWFVERAAEAGLVFTHVNGASGKYFYPEILPPGVGLFDYDRDGDLDVFVVQGYALGGSNAPAGGTGGAQLFRNDLEIGSDGRRTLRFTNVTSASGIVATGYGMGVATGDIDNDGDVDLYVTNFGPNQMFRNNGDGSFTDVSKESATTNQPGFAVSAAFLDYDRDGWLDLYVGNNVTYALDNKTVCPNPAGAPDYCPPQIYGGRADRLYRNAGHGRFVDVTTKALPGLKPSPALGVSTADFNSDGWVDVYVANDGEEDFLWINQRDGTFKESGLASGVAVTAEGKPEASMGLDAGDFDNDGDEDVLVAELTSQGTNLFVNDGAGRFRDTSAASGIGALSLPYTGWGTSWLDYDNDGWLDALTVNGTIIEQAVHKGHAFPYGQRKLLFRNLGTGRFEDASRGAGPAFELNESGRGAAFGDVDNDGDVDVVVGNDAGPLRLFVNQVGASRHWLGLRLLDTNGRDALGARVQVVCGDGRVLWRRARADGSYASANDPRVLVGLGTSAEPVDVAVHWPDGQEERWPKLPIDRWTALTQGTAR